MNIHTRPEEHKVGILNQLVSDALDAHDGDVRKATSFLTNKLMRDKTALAEVLNEVIFNAAQHLVNIKNLAARALVCRTADAVMREKASGEWNGPQVVERVVSARGGLLNFVLSGGLRLADATTKEIRAQRDDYRLRGRDMSRKAEFLDSVAKKLPEGKKTKSVFSNDDLQKLWERASAKTGVEA